uniref:Uncharacterized protein n=1 Tax=viral metagenome TaxID=1070528 RepID=A0A6C0DJ24_9ZZZZ
MDSIAIGAMDMVQQKVTDGIRSVVRGPIGTHIQRAMDLFKKDDTGYDTFDVSTNLSDSSSNPLNIFKSDSSSNPLNIFKSDSSANPLNIFSNDSSSNLLNFGPLFKSDSPSDASSKGTSLTPSWALVLKILGIAMAIMFASWSSNLLIFNPWPIRLLTFVLVLLGCLFSTPVSIIIFMFFFYYFVSAIYYNSGRPEGSVARPLTPIMYGLLPLRTAKAGGLGMIGNILMFPFTYFNRGDKDPYYKKYKETEKKYIESIEISIPNWETIKNTLGVPTLMAEFIDHIDKMNVAFTTDLSGNATGSTIELTSNLSVQELIKKFKETEDDEKDSWRRKKILDLVFRKLDAKKQEDKQSFNDIIKEFITAQRFKEASFFSKILIAKLEQVDPTGTEMTVAKTALQTILVGRKGKLEEAIKKLEEDIAAANANGLDVKALTDKKTAYENALIAVTREEKQVSRALKSPATLLDTSRGSEPNENIKRIANEIIGLIERQAGGSSTGISNSKLAIATEAETVLSSIDPKNKELNDKLKELYDILNDSDRVDWDVLTRAAQYIVTSRQAITDLEQLSNKDNEIALKKEDIQRSSNEIATTVIGMMKRVSNYEPLKNKIALHPSLNKVAQTLEDHMKPVQALNGLIKPVDKIPGKIEEILVIINSKKDIKPLENVKHFQEPVNEHKKALENPSLAVRAMENKAKILAAAKENAKPTTFQKLTGQAPTAEQTAQREGQLGTLQKQLDASKEPLEALPRKTQIVSRNTQKEIEAVRAADTRILKPASEKSIMAKKALIAAQETLSRAKGTATESQEIARVEQLRKEAEAAKKEYSDLASKYVDTRNAAAAAVTSKELSNYGIQTTVPEESTS